VSDLVTISGVEQSVVSHHLTRLRNDKLVRVRREGKLALYSLSNEARQLLDALWPRSENAPE
jgi:DNA-binding transcriptional ArsR family regulator